jgi:hypothetical protein
MCKVGAGCNRRICFFAHRPEELRPLPEHLASADGKAGFKYSLSALTSDNGQGQQQQQKQQQQAGQLKLLPDQQVGAQGGACGQAGFSSSSSSASTANLLMSSNGSIHSNSTSPSVAHEAGRLAAAAAGTPGRDALQPQRDPVMVLEAMNMNAAAHPSPHAVFTTAKGVMTTQLPPRVPQLAAAAAAAAGGPMGPMPAWQQHNVARVGLQSDQGLGLQDSHPMLLPLQQQQQQQYRELIVSDGLALQLQQLGLGDTYAIGTTAGAVLHNPSVLLSASAAQTMQPGALLANQVVTPAWQQQQQQQQAVLFAVQQQQQQQQQLLLRPASAALAVSAAAPALLPAQAGLVSAAPIFQQQQQQQHLLLQSHAGIMPGLIAVTSAPDQLCNGALLQQQQQLYLGQQYVGQHPGLFQQGQVSACTWTG